jgi:hypothetical protein
MSGPNTLLALLDHGAAEADELDAEATSHLVQAMAKAQRAALIRLGLRIAAEGNES